MNIKILIQLLLFTILASTVTAYYYFYKNNKTNTNINKINNNNEISINKNSSNLIKNIYYSSTDNLGNKFIIKSNTGEINIDNPNFVYMVDVEAVINLINSDPIIIKSNYAKYNSQNYDTHFFDNVDVNYVDHKIICKNLNFLFEKNLVIFSDSIVYTNLQNKIEADRLEIDLITKNSKIFMNDESKKIKALVIN